MDALAASVNDPAPLRSGDQEGLAADMHHAVYSVPRLSSLSTTISDDLYFEEFEWLSSAKRTPSLEAVHQDVLAVTGYLSGDITAVHRTEESDALVYNMLLDGRYRLQFRITGPALRQVLDETRAIRRSIAEHRDPVDS
jgi:hypothetical protein